MSVRNLAEAFADYRGWINDPRPRIGIGFPFFDVATNGGLARSEIGMFMAFSSVGKTTLALNAIRNNPDVPTLFFSIEMNWRMVAARLAAMEVPTSTGRIESDYRNIEDDHPSYIYSVVDKYRVLVCDDTPAIKLRDAKESFMRAADRLGEPPRFVIFDYLGLIGGGGLSSKPEKIERTAEDLRNWTRDPDIDCSTLVLHQVGKGDSQNSGADPLSIDSGKYGGHEPMDYVIGGYAPRLQRSLTPYEKQRVQEDLYLQLLKSRAGAAPGIGVQHRLDHKSLRISEWGSLNGSSSYYVRPDSIDYEPQEALV